MLIGEEYWLQLGEQKLMGYQIENIDIFLNDLQVISSGEKVAMIYRGSWKLVKCKNPEITIRVNLGDFKDFK